MSAQRGEHASVDGQWIDLAQPQRFIAAWLPAC
jgi:hypothetical protein